MFASHVQTMRDKSELCLVSLVFFCAAFVFITLGMEGRPDIPILFGMLVTAMNIKGNK